MKHSSPAYAAAGFPEVFYHWGSILVAMRSCFAFPVGPSASKRKSVQVGVGTRILNFGVVRGWMRRLGRHRTLKRQAITAGHHSSSFKSTSGSRTGAAETTPPTLFLNQASRRQRRSPSNSACVQTLVV